MHSDGCAVQGDGAASRSSVRRVQGAAVSREGRTVRTRSGRALETPRHKRTRGHSLGDNCTIKEETELLALTHSRQRRAEGVRSGRCTG